MDSLAAQRRAPPVPLTATAAGAITAATSSGTASASAGALEADDAVMTSAAVAGAEIDDSASALASTAAAGGGRVGGEGGGGGGIPSIFQRAGASQDFLDHSAQMMRGLYGQVGYTHTGEHAHMQADMFYLLDVVTAERCAVTCKRTNT